MFKQICIGKMPLAQVKIIYSSRGKYYTDACITLNAQTAIAAFAPRRVRTYSSLLATF